MRLRESIIVIVYEFLGGEGNGTDEGGAGGSSSLDKNKIDDALLISAWRYNKDTNKDTRLTSG